ncbi:hypothetical protein JYU34_009780 [Plutella xylostella]|uniref:Uncharacterized protein n=1 Tax=Plutella xylostella TaxID=51655 RepID=A0ABQ7QKD6_PLUXY|nr:hypothetical protein JYU34_009780 [Plutella xylostella]
MNRYAFFIAVFVSLALVTIVTSQQSSPRHCYRFTWLGPDYNNGSVYLNATCNDVTKLSDKEPCMEPLVVSMDGTWPNVSYIWDNHKEQATCVLGDSEYCAQYTFYFNGTPLNSTYMCTKALTSNNTVVSPGCYTQTIGSFKKRVCLCVPIAGGMPCNRANPTSATTLFTMGLVTTAAILFLNKNL